MNSISWVIFMGLLMNIPSLAPVLFLRKASKNVKVSMALRLFLLNAFLVLSLVTVSQNTTQKYWLFPVWLIITAIGLFAVTLVPTVKFMRKHLTVGKSRAVILSSFLMDIRLMDTMWCGRCSSCLPACWLILVVQGVKHILVILHRHLHRNQIILSRPKNIRRNHRLITILL